MSTEINNPNGIIYVEVPHQLPSKAYGFATQEEFQEWLKRVAPDDVNYQEWDKADWDYYLKEIEGDKDESWYDAAMVETVSKLFAEGATTVVKHNDDIYDKEDTQCPSQWDAILMAMDDFHTTYVFNREEAIAIDGGDYRRLCPHQLYKSAVAISREARSLGWVDVEEIVDEEDEDEDEDEE